MSVAQHAPTSTATQHKRKPLSPARVYQAWAADVSQHGRRGAFRRTAELVGCSPEYIRQLVAKHEAEHTLAPELFTTHELDYMPAPGELPLRTPTQPEPIATKKATNSTPATCDTYVKPDADLNVNRCETGELPQLATDKQPAERENTVLSLGELPTAAPLTSAPHTPALCHAPVKHYPQRSARRDLDLAQLVDVLTYQIGPVPVASVLVFLVLLYIVAR